MLSSMVRIRLLLPSLFAVSLFGCALTGPSVPTYLVPGHAGAPGVERILLLPMNLDSSLPDFLIEASDSTRDALARSLERGGRSVERVRLREARALWREAVQQVGGFLAEDGTVLEERRDLAYAELASRLAEDREFDALVAPKLTIQKALASGRFGRWDGAEAEVEYVVEEKHITIQESALLMRGATRGLSLTVRVHALDGTRVFEARQGLELVDRIRLTGRYYRLEVRPDLCADTESLDARMLDALHPYIVRPAIEAAP